MSTVTKIGVKYGRTVSGPKDYESRNASAEIGVALEEGGIDVELELTEAMVYATDVVHTTLGLQPPKSEAATKTASSTTSGTANGNISDNPEDRKDSEVELTPAQKATATRKRNAAAKKAKEAAEEETPEVEIDDDDIDIDDAVGEEPVEDEGEEIDDAELSLIINSRVKSLREEGHPDAVKRIKAAIASFNTEDDENFTAGDLGQAQRLKFVAKLKAIQIPKKV